MTTTETQFRTAEVARLADVSLRQLQMWEEKRIAIASRERRVRRYSVSQALFVMVLAELLRRRGLSSQRLRRLSVVVRQALSDHGVHSGRCAFLLTDGKNVQFANSQNQTCEIVSNFSKPILCVNVSACLDRIKKNQFV